MTEKSLNTHIELAHPGLDMDQVRKFRNHVYFIEKVIIHFQVKLDKLEGKNPFADNFKKDGWECKKCRRKFDSKEIYEYHMQRHESSFKE